MTNGPYRRVSILGVLTPADGNTDIHQDIAAKFVKDVLALAMIHGVEFVGSVTGLTSRNEVVLHRGGSSLLVNHLDKGVVGAQENQPELPQAPLTCLTHTADDDCYCDVPQSWGGRGVRGGAPMALRVGPAELSMHSHRHDHNDHLYPTGVVRITHEHWHVHNDEADFNTARRDIYHSGLHLSFGNRSEPTAATYHFDEWPSPVSALAKEVDNTALTEDGRLLAEHVKVCAACRDCEACRQSVLHTHIDPSLNHGAHDHSMPRLTPFCEEEMVNAERRTR